MTVGVTMLVGIVIVMIVVVVVMVAQGTPPAGNIADRRRRYPWGRRATDQTAPAAAGPTG